MASNGQWENFFGKHPVGNEWVNLSVQLFTIFLIVYINYLILHVQTMHSKPRLPKLQLDLKWLTVLLQLKHRPEGRGLHQHFCRDRGNFHLSLNELSWHWGNTCTVHP